MATQISTSRILAKINAENLSLYKGDGYWYFILDNGAGLFENHSVYAMRLSDMPLASWVEEGKAFVAGAMR